MSERDFEFGVDPEWAGGGWVAVPPVDGATARKLSLGSILEAFGFSEREVDVIADRIAGHRHVLRAGSLKDG